MATRIKDWEVPYTWWIGIEITNNHVINVLLRELNNLIHVNEDRELYVDLQLDAGIAPDDDFPVWVTTWEILQEDWWPQNGTIINWKTTSWDYTRIIYANDWKLYYDPWTWVWNPFLSPWDLTIATASEPWILKLGSDVVQTEAIETPTAEPWRTYAVQLNNNNQAMVNVPWVEYESLIEDQWGTDESLVTTGEKFIWNHKQDQLTAWTRISITVDQQTWNTIISADVSGILTYKWNVTNIADLPSSWQSVWDTYFVEWADAMYSWDWTQWNLVWGTAINLNDYFNKTIDDSDDITQWTTNLFCTTLEKNTWNNKQDTIIAWDNITIGLDWKTINAASYYAGTWLSLNNYTFNNTKPFDPANQWSLGWLLQKTSDWYEWREPNFVTSVNWQTWAVTVDEFDPENAGSTGQVLKKTDTGYEWSNEKAGVYTWWDWIDVNNASKTITNTKPFDPSNTGRAGQVIKLNSDWTYSWQDDNTWGGWWGWWWVTSVNGRTWAVTVLEVSEWWTTGQVLTKKQNGYGWETIAGWEWNVKLFTLSGTSDTTNAKAAIDWLDSWKLAIIKINATFWYVSQTGDYYFYPIIDSNSTNNIRVFHTVPTSNDMHLINGVCEHRYPTLTVNMSNGDVSSIVLSVTHAAREDIQVSWKWTQAQYDFLPSSKLTDWVIYNIISE